MQVRRVEDDLGKAGAIEDCKKRAEALVELVPCLIELSPAMLCPLWREALHTLANRTRGDLLSDIRALAPVLAALGGQEVIEQTFYAIRRTGRWFSTARNRDSMPC